MKLPRIMLAAPGSGSGKTYITCGVLAALYNRGCKVCAMKCGPDYIDPMFHETVLCTKSRNLDPFFASEKLLIDLFAHAAADKELSVVEGVMGYYDGLGGMELEGSSYDLAQKLKLPVILVVNCKGMSRSVIAYIKGFLEYQEDSRIQGVILNKMSPMMYKSVKTQIEQELGITVFGYLPEQKSMQLQSRHLGLVLPQEIEGLREDFLEVGKEFEKTLEIDRLIDLARMAEDLDPEPVENYSCFEPRTKEKETVVIAVAKDEAFCFYYEDNLEYLRRMGAKLKYFSPLHDTKLPEADGILLGGGYPELYAKELSENTAMKQQLREMAKQHMPMLAECGGFMYLQQKLTDMQGNSYDMAAVLPGESYYTGKLGRFGYITLTTEDGYQMKGHEFHYFDSTENGSSWQAQKPVSGKQWDCMTRVDQILAGFPHLYYPSAPTFAKTFVEACRTFHCAGKSTGNC